jgi:hypothetical protein
MPGGGELTLVAFGNQNSIVSANPEITYFYKVFKRYTHFSQESITISMDGPNELTMDSAIRLRAKIPRSADLLSDLTLVMDIPPMYSKFAPVPDSEEDQNRYFRWVRMLGVNMIDRVAIYVGGSKIQEFTGEWLAVRAAVDLPADKYLKWRTMIGDVPELNDPEWGLYGRAANYPYEKGEYPVSVPDASGNTPAPSTPVRQLRVPLPFWFSETWGRALPLISLQLHEVEVQITMRTLREIYRLYDLTFNKEPLRYGRGMNLDTTKPTSNDPTDPSANDNLTLQTQYEGYNDPAGLINQFYYPDGGVPVSQIGFDMGAHLEGNYIYVTTKEQVMFAERELNELVHQVQVFTFTGIASAQKLDLDAHGLVSRMIFFGRRSDAIDVRNDYTNLSNWKNLDQATFWPAVMAPDPQINNAGIQLPGIQRDILQSAQLICAGNELFEVKPANFFEVQNPYTYTTGGGIAGVNPGGLRPCDVMGPLYQINFALNSSDHEQPSGTFNASRVREIQLAVTPWPLATDSTYTYDFTVYVENLNVIKILNGMAGLQFAI